MLFQKLLNNAANSLPSIEYVGGYVTAFQGTTSNPIIPLTSLTGGIASAPAAGDLVIVYFGTGSTTDRNLVISGYTEVVELYAGSTFDTNLVVARKFMSATPDTNFVIVGGTGSADDAAAVAVQVWRGVNATTPLDVAATTVTTNNSILCNPPAITPITQNAIIVAGGAGAHNGGDETYSSSDLTGFQTAGHSDINDVVIGLGYHNWTLGSFNPAQFTCSQGDSTSYSSAGVTLALRPA